MHRRSEPPPEAGRQILPEEHGRTPVREDEAYIFQSGRQVMGGDLFQKRCHTAKICAPYAKLLHKRGKSLPKIRIPGEKSVFFRNLV
jgi:hypothetical protein